MLPKVAGYAGFQSYGELPYPNLKAGKTVLSPQDIWEKTTREQDHQNYSENYHYTTSNYKKTHVENTAPIDYKEHKHVKPGNQRSIRKAGSETLTKFNPEDQNSHLNTGVEHWKSNYNANIKDPYQYSVATRPEWTLAKKPYTVQSKVGPSEYITQLGELGSRPIDKFHPDGTEKQGKLDHPLKMGTTQATYHIPGYTGFIPQAHTSGIPLEQAKSEQPRQVFSKISVVENYNTKIPGYAGHQPQNPINQRGEPRDSCFSTFKA